MRTRTLSIFLAQIFSLGVWGVSAPLWAAPTPTFAKIRALGLPDVRTLAIKRAPSIALANAKVKAAEAEAREISRRLKINTTGGLDPFSGQVRFYLALDLERLAGLNKGEKDKAARGVEAEKIGATEAQNAAIKSVTEAWFTLRRAIDTEKSATRQLVTARALYTASDARFKAGIGELNAVLSAMSARSNAEDNLRAARAAIILACLDLAQACGYSTAEEMEAALIEAARADTSKPPPPRPSPRAKLSTLSLEMLPDEAPEESSEEDAPELWAEIEPAPIEPDELATP